MEKQIPHGTVSAYCYHKCRCELCREANTAAARKRRGPKLTPQDRFWAKVEKTETCWSWTGSRTGGYGMVSIGGGSPKLAHRVSYEWEHGTIPPGMKIDHRCHNKACVNPAHLRLATTKQNAENLRGASQNNPSGVRGVSWHPPTKKWDARVTHFGVRYRLGLFTSIEEAEAAVVAKRLELYTHNDLDRAA